MYMTIDNVSACHCLPDTVPMYVAEKQALADENLDENFVKEVCVFHP